MLGDIVFSRFHKVCKRKPTPSITEIVLREQLKYSFFYRYRPHLAITLFLKLRFSFRNLDSVCFLAFMLGVVLAELLPGNSVLLVQRIRQGLVIWRLMLLKDCDTWLL